MQLLRTSVPEPPEELCKPEAADFWLPETGSWLWWFQHRLVVLCEDVGAKVFADARNWLRSEAGQTVEWTEEEGKSLDSFRWQLKHVMPYILNFPTLFKHGDLEVIGLGRDIEHRRRAACLGFAALWSSETLTPKRRKVAEEVRAAGWFPKDRIERFYDLQQCWCNMESPWVSI